MVVRKMNKFSNFSKSKPSIGHESYSIDFAASINVCAAF